MGAVSSLIINTLYQFTLTLIFSLTRGLFETGVCRLFQNPTSPLSSDSLHPHPTGDSLHPHPADTPDALSLVPRACCFPPSGGQNADAAL
jgi:hypothetical protein